MKRGILISALFIAGLLIAWFSFRNYFLNHYLEKAKIKTEALTGLKVQINNKGFKGFSKVFLENIIVVTPEADTFFHCKKFNANISFTGYLTGGLPVNNLFLEDAELIIAEQGDSISRWSFLSKQKSDSTFQNQTPVSKQNYVQKVNKAWNVLMKASNTDAKFRNLKMKWTSENYHESLFIHELNIQQSNVIVNAQHLLNDTLGNITSTGKFDKKNAIINFSATMDNQIPFLEKIYQVKLYADSSYGYKQNKAKSRDESIFEISFKAVSPGINHWRISNEDVVADSSGLKLTLVVNDNSVKADTLSSVFFNRIPFHIDFLIYRADSTHYAFQMGFDSIPSNDFFNSLPKTLFGTLNGIETKGDLNYNLQFAINPDNPDSLIFESSLQKHNFSITKFGEENFRKINQPFTHFVRVDDKVVRTVNVSDSNHYYTPLLNISPLLINVILTSEDAAFFHHKGFSERAFRQSIATNFKEKRFARGGSTISMQLVKNVFLERNKTITRKVEEAIIVWLIENNRLVSKERILEVYLNIIEWGPGIYGIGEASEFYFLKKPHELSLEESIYLSAIIPRPRYFKYLFEKDGSIREYMRDYFNIVTERMLKKEIIDEVTASNMNFMVELKGKAREVVIPTDTLPADSIQIELPQGILFDQQ